MADATQQPIQPLKLEGILTLDKISGMTHKEVEVILGSYHREIKALFPPVSDHPFKILGITNDSWVVYSGDHAAVLSTPPSPWGYVEIYDPTKRNVEEMFGNAPIGHKTILATLIEQYEASQTPERRQAVSAIEASTHC